MFDRLVSNLRELGVADGLWYTLGRGLTVVRLGNLHKYLIYAQPLAGRRRLSERRGRNITTRWLEPGAAELKGIPRPGSVIAQRYAQHARCLAAFIDDRLVGCLWCVAGRYAEDEVRCDFDFNDQHDCIWDFDVYVAPEHRLGMVFLRMWDDVEAALFAQGYRWSLSRISAFNHHSIRSHERLGARPIGWAVFLTLGSWQWDAGSFARGVRWSRRAGERPRLKIALPSTLRADQARGSHAGTP